MIEQQNKNIDALFLFSKKSPKVSPFCFKLVKTDFLDGMSFDWRLKQE